MLELLLDGDYRGLFALLISSFLNIFPFLHTTTKLIGDFLNKRVYFLFLPCNAPLLLVPRINFIRMQRKKQKQQNLNSLIVERFMQKIRSASLNDKFILLHILLPFYLHIPVSSFPSPSQSSPASLSPSIPPSPSYFPEGCPACPRLWFFDFRRNTEF